MRPLSAIAALLLLTACPKKNERPVDHPDVPATQPAKAPAPTDRVAAIANDHPLHDRVEGTGFGNACTTDAACMTSGCSGEVCSAENVNTTCEFPEGGFPKGDACGCVSGQCVWYRSGSEKAELPKQGERCESGRCAEGLTCVEYYGVAGPKGPKLMSCEIPCSNEKTVCPAGQTCVTIADGPGKVCRG